MSDNVYGAELDLNINKFKSKVNEASNQAKSLGKQLSVLNKGGFAGDNFINIFSNRLSIASGEVKNLGNNFRLVKPAVQEATNEVEKLDNSVQKTSKSTNKIGGEISKSFNKGLKSVKRLTLGFLGARSAFMLFRKYLGEYQSQNEDFANKMQLTTNVLVNSLAPAFEFFANVVQYAVIGLARIIELLTGVNILGKTIDNGFKGASKSVKEFNENLSGLDEISNIDQSSANGLSSGIGSQLNALNEFQKKIAEVDKWLEDSGIKKFFEDLRPIVKDVFGWIAEHPLETLGLIGGIKMLTSLLPSLLGSAAAGTGLLGLNQVLLGLAAIGVITISVKLIVDNFNETHQEIEEGTKAWEGLGDQQEELQQKIKETVSTTDDASSHFDLLSKYAKTNADNLKYYSEQIEKQNKNMSTGKFTINYWLGTFKEQQAQMDTATKSTETYITGLAELRKQQGLTDDEQKEYIDLLLDTKSKLEEAGVKGKNYEDLLNLIGSELRELNGKKFTATLGIDTSSANNSISNFFQKWFGNNPLLKKALNITGIPSYDVGTNYVPRDQIAMVHEGEAIIPKKYNNSEYLGQIGNSETNALLYELNRSIIEFANRPQTLNVNGKELAKVTYGDYQEEGSRRGANTSIRRV